MFKITPSRCELRPNDSVQVVIEGCVSRSVSLSVSVLATWNEMLTKRFTFSSCMCLQVSPMVVYKDGTD